MENNNNNKKDDLKLLWHCSFYDHPINGIAELNGKKIWFEIFEDIDEEELEDGTIKNSKLTYNLYELSEDELNYRLESHLLIQKNGYFNHDHLPEIFKPCFSENSIEIKLPIFNIKHKTRKFIKNVYWNEFQYFWRNFNKSECN
jgi:hypothetical protein